jgi:hypothetical protein
MPCNYFATSAVRYAVNAAIGLLQQAQGELKGKPLQRVDNALKQLNTALSIK